MKSASPCLACGACCATYRVSFYWTEADDAPGGWVPAALTEQLTQHLRCMQGTNQKSPHCAQLQGGVPGGMCTIYANRPSPCRELEPFTPSGEVTAQCAKARAHHGLPPLQPIAPAKLV